MIEGLWVIKLLTPDDPSMDLNGGVVVIETDRIFGGDSGYFYIGSLRPAEQNTWSVAVQITRHDPNIESIFGDTDKIELTGTIHKAGKDQQDRSLIKLKMRDNATAIDMTALMTKVADLP